MRTKYTLQPTRNRVAVKPIAEEMVSQAGIILPEIAERRPVKGRIVAVGSDVQGFAVGETVLYPRYAGVEVEVDREVFIVLADHELVARILEVEAPSTSD